MATTKEQGKPFDLRTKVTLYAPKGAPYHSEGEEVQVGIMQKEKFLKAGFTAEKSGTKKTN